MLPTARVQSTDRFYGREGSRTNPAIESRGQGLAGNFRWIAEGETLVTARRPELGEVTPRDLSIYPIGTLGGSNRTC